MSSGNSLSFCETHETAGNDSREIQKAGFDKKNRSMIRKEPQMEEHVGSSTIGGRILHLHKLGAYPAIFWGLLLCSAFLWGPLFKIWQMLSK